MILPEHTIVAAFHHGMTVDGIAAMLCDALPATMEMPLVLGRGVEIRDRVLEVLRRHRPCPECEEFTRWPTPQRPQLMRPDLIPPSWWRRTPRRSGDPPDMVLDGVPWYLHPPVVPHWSTA